MEKIPELDSNNLRANENESVIDAWRGMLRREIDDMIALRSLAGVQLSNIDAEFVPDVMKRGAVGLLLIDGKGEIVESGIARWSVYFAGGIDKVLKAAELIEQYPSDEGEYERVLYKVAADITRALDRSLMSKAYPQQTE